ncbi:MAG: DUF4040 domain-containing protein [Clostridia bacterium]|nr:DUF4040 domain-containing protein [Clostridia bacterium]
MELYLIIAAIFTLAFLAPMLHKWFPKAIGWILASVPAAVFAYLIYLSIDIGYGLVVYESYAWIPSLGISMSFYLDGLSLLFLLMITAIGALVLIYSGYYMQHYSLKGRFYFYLMLFMGAMMGLVLSGNLISIFVFWELTSISSYLLIGFFHEKTKSRAAALQALLVTALGGLALMAGMVLINLSTGTYEIIELLNEREILQNSPYYLAILILVGLGAMTKSAQFPFHFWLPSAMAGPSPVSAFLHSATMVKAGIYILLRLAPVLGGTLEWRAGLSVVGLVTMLVGAYFSLTQKDLKAILAYSTIMALGTLMLLVGIDTYQSIKAAIIFLVVHSLYKGALFMVAGSIDKQTGTRDIYQLGGLFRTMPYTTVVALLALFSMAGLPPFIGFVGKEMIYEAKSIIPETGNLPLIASIIANAFMVAISAIIAWHVFFAKAGNLPKQPKETPFRLWVGPAVLSALSLLLALFPGFFDRNIAEPAIGAVWDASVSLQIKLWHGFNLVLLYSVITIAVGALIFAFRKKIIPAIQKFNERFFAIDFAQKFLDMVDGFLHLTKKKTDFIQGGVQRYYLMIIFVTASALVWYQLFYTRFWDFNSDIGYIPFYAAGVAVVVIAATVVAVFSKSRVVALIAMGMVGWGLALIFAFYGAIDLAITQIMTETLVLVIFVMIIYHLPVFKSFSRLSTRIRDGVIAVVFGGFMMGLSLKADYLNLYPAISDYFAQNSFTEGHGRNIVNVILVDFRAMDTLGEITVLTIAAIGVFVLMRMKNKKTEELK